MELGGLGSNLGSRVSYRATRPSPNSNAFCEPNPEAEVRSDFDDAWQRILSEPPSGNGNVAPHWTLHEGGWYFYQHNLLVKRQAEANLTKLVK